MAEGQSPPLPLDRSARRDPVLHETMSAIMWLAHAIASIGEGRPELAKYMVDLARESVFKALALADADPPSEKG